MNKPQEFIRNHSTILISCILTIILAATLAIYIVPNVDIKLMSPYELSGFLADYVWSYITAIGTIAAAWGACYAARVSLHIANTENERRKNSAHTTAKLTSIKVKAQLGILSKKLNENSGYYKESTNWIPERTFFQNQKQFIQEIQNDEINRDDLQRLTPFTNCSEEIINGYKYLYLSTNLINEYAFKFEIDFADNEGHDQPISCLLENIDEYAPSRRKLLDELRPNIENAKYHFDNAIKIMNSFNNEN